MPKPETNKATPRPKSKRARWTPTAKPLPGANPPAPAKPIAGAPPRAPERALPAQLVQYQQSEPPSSPRVPNTANNYTGTKAREAPPWWHADLCQDHKHARLDKDQKTTILGGILAEEIDKTPDKRLARHDCNATASLLSGPRQDPCPGH